MSCGNAKKSQTSQAASLEPTGPVFNADSAYQFCAAQCQFGPRTMNSVAHDQCGQWIAQKFRSYGLQVTEQRAVLTGYDGTPLHSTNIMASYRPEQADRILICAHWDSRPWADNDPSSDNWHQPVMAANDGASGVAIMLELARLLSPPELGGNRGLNQDSIAPSDPQPPNLGGFGVDFLCFDAEDWGVPQWAETDYSGDSWALGAQYWAAHLVPDGYKARYGILLDMVGGQGARFYQEGYSLAYARNVIDKVWAAARVVGFGSYFPNQEGGTVTDDHVPVNQVAHIPCIDIIPYYPDCEASSFGPTWHTVSDDMQHIDKGTLQAVGQTLVQVICSEQ